MIFVTGDTHIPIDIHKLNSKNFPEQKSLTKKDYVIICGNFGGVWDNSKTDKYWLKWLQQCNYTTLFIDGNHENFELLYKYPVENWNGGKIHKITKSVFHLMRGQVFDIDNKKIFTMGGASSHDRLFRVDHKSWWEEEFPCEAEMAEGIKNLEINNNKVDIIISHCCPTSIMKCLNTEYKSDKLTEYFEKLQCLIEYKQWFFGHYHEDEKINDKFTVLYNDIIKI